MTNTLTASSVINMPPETEQKARTLVAGKAAWEVNDLGEYCCIASSQTSIKAGVYKLTWKGPEPKFIPVKNHADKLINFENSVGNQLISQNEQFWKLKEQYRKMDMVFKRGILMYGPTGTGKTSIINQLAANLIEQHNGIVILVTACEPKLVVTGLNQLRVIEGEDRPIMVVYEDFEQCIDYWGEDEYLSLLDGGTQLNNVVHIATTNYIEKLDKRLTSRPARFDIVVRVGWPDESQREHYINSKLDQFDPDHDIDVPEIDVWVKRTKDFSMAHIRELLILVLVFKKPFEQAIEYIDKMRTGNLSSDDDYSTTKIGFV